MKRVLFTALGMAPAMTGADLVPGQAGGPILATPGTATWATEPIGSGIRTTYTINADTILEWPELYVPGGDELIFDFISGNSIANMLGDGVFHAIDGSVISNGNVGFFAANAHLAVGGSVTAQSVTLATLGVDPADYLDGGTLSMQGSGAMNFLSVSGDVTATDGDVVMAGGFIDVDDTANITANGRLFMGGHSESAVLYETGRYRLHGSGAGHVLNLGSGSASTIDIRAGTEIANAGRLQAGSTGKGKIYLEVDPGGQITNEGTGIIVGATNIVGDYDDDGTTLYPDEGDVAGAVNSSELKIPALRRPDGSRFARERLVSNHAPMTASADSARDRSSGSLAVARVERRSLMKRASFFGMRGGKSADNSKKKSR